MKTGDLFRVRSPVVGSVLAWADHAKVGDRSIASFRSGVGLYLERHRVTMAKVLINNVVCVMYDEDIEPVDFMKIKRLSVTTSAAANHDIIEDR